MMNRADPPQELGVAVGLQHGHPPVAHGHLKPDHGRQDGRIAKPGRERHTERGQHETEVEIGVTAFLALGHVFSSGLSRRRSYRMAERDRWCSDKQVEASSQLTDDDADGPMFISVRQPTASARRG